MYCVGIVTQTYGGNTHRFPHNYTFFMITLALGISAWGCGGAKEEGPTTYEGNAGAHPHISVLPSYPQNWNDLSSSMRFGWTLAEISFSFEDPPRPPGSDPDTLATWSETTFSDWFTQKMDTVEHAREELNLASEKDPKERIMAAALVGLLYEDVARALRTLPSSAQEQGNASGSGQSYMLHAKAAYEACAGNAKRTKGFKHWRPFCARRASQL